MRKLEKYNGSISLLSGITQMSPDDDYALVEAHAIQTDDNGTRLDEELLDIKNKLNGGGGGFSLQSRFDIETGVFYIELTKTE